MIVVIDCACHAAAGQLRAAVFSNKMSGKWILWIVAAYSVAALAFSTFFNAAVLQWLCFRSDVMV